MVIGAPHIFILSNALSLSSIIVEGEKYYFHTKCQKLNQLLIIWCKFEFSKPRCPLYFSLLFWSSSHAQGNLMGSCMLIISFISFLPSQALPFFGLKLEILGAKIVFYIETWTSLMVNCQDRQTLSECKYFYIFTLIFNYFITHANT